MNKTELVDEVASRVSPHYRMALGETWPVFIDWVITETFNVMVEAFLRGVSVRIRGYWTISLSAKGVLRIVPSNKWWKPFREGKVRSPYGKVRIPAKD